MSYQVSFTSEATDDLRNIYRYIAFELLAPQNAKQQIYRLERATASLATFPERYKVLEDKVWKSRDLRAMPCDNFLIFYVVNLKEEVVIIVRILYGKRNFDVLLK